MDKTPPCTLRFYISRKYPSIAAFAAEIGWSRNRVQDTISRKRQPSKAEMEALVRLLDIPAAAIAPVFFGSMFSESTTNRGLQSVS